MRQRKLCSALLAVFTLLFLLVVAGCNNDKVSIKDGVYTGTGKGKNGPITVEVTFQEGAIKKIVVVSQNETEGLSDPALSRIPAEIVKHQSIAVDEISGASYTSRGLKEAVQDAIVQANGDPQQFNRKVAKTAQEAEKYDTDIVIVGGGGSGLMAAVEASRAGAKVIVLEKAAFAGGISAFGAGIGAVESSWQKEKGVDFTAQEIYTHMLEYAKAAVYAPLLRRIVGESGKNLDWAAKEFGWDVKFVYPNIWGEEAYATYHLVYPYGPSRFAPVVDDIQKHGGTILLETEGTALLKDGDSVSGVKAVKADGTPVIVHAKAVILATGGAFNNKEMLVTYTGSDAYIQMQPSLSDGAGINMALNAGAAFTNELFVEVAEIGMTPGVPENPKWNLNLMSVAGLLHVNTNGIRYFNEGLFKEEPLNIGGASVGNGGPYFVVFDQKTYDTVIREGLIGLIPDSEKAKWEKQYERLSQYGATSGVPPMFAGIAHPLDNLEAEMGQAYDMGIAWKADTIEALADKMELPNLVSTVKRYQELVKQGQDEDLYKNSIFLTDISSAPFYAISFLPAGFNTLGGVKVNENLEALTNDNVPIRGLYVAGVDGGSMFHKPYYDICGTSMMYAIGSGRIAGREAAKYVASK